MFRIFQNIDVGAKAVYKVDVLAAMRWVQEDWINLKSETVANSWRHFFKSYLTNVQDPSTDTKK